VADLHVLPDAPDERPTVHVTTEMDAVVRAAALVGRVRQDVQVRHD